jgi:putative ATP-dependent endonuclease of the OLD family
MVYREIIRRKVHALIVNNDSIANKEKYAETYLSFHNIAIVPHHGKITAILLMKLCEHIGVNYFAINDWDLDEDFAAVLSLIENEEDLKQARHYLESEKKSVINTNWKLLRNAKDRQIHFNVPKLEAAIGYNSDNKSSYGIWNRLQEAELSELYSPLVPAALEDFLSFRSLSNAETEIDVFLQDSEPFLDDDLPF